MQERLLAPRMLHFGAFRLFWQCAQLNLASEQYPHGMFDPKWSKNVPYAAPGALTDTIQASGKALSLYELWRGVFVQYGESHLSYPNKDKLIALQGVGKRLAELYQVRYHEGYLDVELPYALCWWNESDPRIRPHAAREWERPPVPARPLEWLRAPSWHWSSSDQRLNYRLTLKYLPHRTGNERYSRNPLIWLFPDHGPFLIHLERDTVLLCLGRLLAVESYRFGPYQSLIIRLFNADRDIPPELRETAHGSIEQDHLLCFCDWSDLKIYEGSGKLKLFLLPVYSQRHTGATDESMDVKRSRIFDCYKAIPPALFSERLAERFDRAGLGALLLAEMEDGCFVRLGAVQAKSSDEPWAYQAMIRSMQRTAPRLITIR